MVQKRILRSFLLWNRGGSNQRNVAAAAIIRCLRSKCHCIPVENRCFLQTINMHDIQRLEFVLELPSVKCLTD